MANPFPGAQFSISVGTPGQLPAAFGTECCLLGRSNVGKSSFINHVFANRTLARVSSRPGKTTLANFYRLTTGETWIDLPGYGYAHASKSELGRLEALVRACCSQRESCRGILWLIDMRHPGLSADAQAREWLVSLKIPVLVVLTKDDKVSKIEGRRLEREHVQTLVPGWEHVRFSIREPGLRQVFWDAYARWRDTLKSA